MNYCKHLKKRKNKPYCNIIKQEITLNQCQQCVNKEYKTKNKINSFYKSNSNQIRKSPVIKKKSPVKSGIMKNKSNKLAKLERDRYSVFTDDLEHCYLCGKKKEDLHEVYRGRNRINSIKYNFILPLCRECHSSNQNNPFFNDYWHRQGQLYWEEFISTREEFIKVFRRNYLK